MKYCEKCGLIISDKSLFKDRTVCPDCKVILQQDDVSSEIFDSMTDEQKQLYTEQLMNKIASNPIFCNELCEYGKSSFYETYWFDKYEQLTGDVAARYGDDLKEHMQAKYGEGSPLYQAELLRRCVAADKAKKEANSNQVHCPYCNSTNVNKISGLAKAGSVALFGIFSQKVKKQWHCNNCKSDF